ncbi:MAG: hypothetical protein ACR2PU_01175 [Gammaproteobacteria bacterium]
MRISILITILVLLSLQTAKSETISITCDYNKFASIQSVENAIEIFRLSFSVNKDTSEAQVMRKNGISDVQLLPTGGGFTFIEVNERGNVLTTTVDIHGKSAHSRNTILDGELIPSQFYGTCDYK